MMKKTSLLWFKWLLLCMCVRVWRSPWSQCPRWQRRIQGWTFLDQTAPAMMSFLHRCHPLELSAGQTQAKKKLQVFAIIRRYRDINACPIPFQGDCKRPFDLWHFYYGDFRELEWAVSISLVRFNGIFFLLWFIETSLTGNIIRANYMLVMII